MILGSLGVSNDGKRLLAQFIAWLPYRSNLRSGFSYPALPETHTRACAYTHHSSILPESCKMGSFLKSAGMTKQLQSCSYPGLPVDL